MKGILYLRIFHKNSTHVGIISGQISIINIIPKPECFGDFGEVPLLNHHLG